MSSLVIGSVVIGRVQFVELFSRNLPADGARDNQNSRIDGGYRRATIVIPRLEKRAWLLRSRSEWVDSRLES